MKALTLNKDTHEFSLQEVKEPVLEGADEVKLKILEVGICGTDRDEVKEMRSVPPESEHELIIGHEMVGRVVEVGHLVTKVSPGDLAIFTVRRGCDQCPACDLDSYDLCYTGKYTERGIKGKHGFQSEYVIDHQKYLIKVPEELAFSAVLCEPMSVVEKAIDLVSEIQKARLPDWRQESHIFRGKRVFIAGVGAIGLLAAMIFLLEGAQVWGYDIVDPQSPRAQLLEHMGGKYLCAKDVNLQSIHEITPHIDVIFEAAGNTKLIFDLIPILSENGVYVITGVTPKNVNVSIDGGTIMENIVMKNQVIIGSVNAHIRHWEKAIRDMELAKKRWKTIPEAFITNRFNPEEFKVPFYTRQENEIKTVIQWEQK